MSLRNESRNFAIELAARVKLKDDKVSHYKSKSIWISSWCLESRFCQPDGNPTPKESWNDAPELAISNQRRQRWDGKRFEDDHSRLIAHYGSGSCLKQFDNSGSYLVVCDCLGREACCSISQKASNADSPGSSVGRSKLSTERLITAVAIKYCKLENVIGWNLHRTVVRPGFAVHGRTKEGIGIGYFCISKGGAICWICAILCIYLWFLEFCATKERLFLCGQEAGHWKIASAWRILFQTGQSAQANDYIQQSFDQY